MPDSKVSDTRVLLAIDGDSLAHRAYHALPKSIKKNAILGFTNFLLRLWDSERPAAVLAAWDTLEETTYRHEALPEYQSGRVFEDSIVDQLDELPEFIASFGFACAKAAGYEADDFLAAAARRWKGPVLVATSDRDAFQLASERVTILQPVKGVSELARIGPAVRGDSSDRIPGARGVGPKTAADILKQYGTLAAGLKAGRFAAEADNLRLYRQIAQMDVKAPLPRLAAQKPNWARAAAAASELGLGALAGRLEARAAEGGARQ